MESCFNGVPVDAVESVGDVDMWDVPLRVGVHYTLEFSSHLLGGPVDAHSELKRSKHVGKMPRVAALELLRSQASEHFAFGYGTHTAR